jgi:hypothetical protein
LLEAGTFVVEPERIAPVVAWWKAPTIDGVIQRDFALEVDTRVPYESHSEECQIWIWIGRIVIRSKHALDAGVVPRNQNLTLLLDRVFDDVRAGKHHSGSHEEPATPSAANDDANGARGEKVF